MCHYKILLPGDPSLHHPDNNLIYQETLHWNDSVLHKEVAWLLLNHYHLDLVLSDLSGVHKSCDYKETSHAKPIKMQKDAVYGVGNQLQDGEEGEGREGEGEIVYMMMVMMS